MKKPFLPFVGTPEGTVKQMVAWANIKPGQKSVDLGAGDGRVVIAMAQAGAIATGCEIQQKYARRAKAHIAHAKLGNCASVKETDFWKEDVSSYDIVTIYGMAAIMERLSKKLSKELRAGTIVISNGFPLPGWKEEKAENHLFLYRKQ